MLTLKYAQNTLGDGGEEEWVQAVQTTENVHAAFKKLQRQRQM